VGFDDPEDGTPYIHRRENFKILQKSMKLVDGGRHQRLELKRTKIILLEHFKSLHLRKNIVTMKT
jgi:hypothetical protein